MHQRNRCSWQLEYSVLQSSNEMSGAHAMDTCTYTHQVEILFILYITVLTHGYITYLVKVLAHSLMV